MKGITIFIISMLTLGTSYGQNDFDPKVIVLIPKIVKIQRGIGKQIEFYKKYGIETFKKYMIEKKDSLIEIISTNDSIPLNLKRHFENQIEFAPYLIFENKISQDYSNSFQSILDYDMENPLVFVSRTRSFDNIDSMQIFADSNSADYLINILEVKISRYDQNDLIIKPVFAFYDRSLNKIQEINLDLTDNNNKSYLTVGDTTLNIYYDDQDERIFMTRYIKDKGTRFEREIIKKRTDTLHYLINTGKRNGDIKKIIIDSGFEYPIDSLYTTFVSTDGNNFLAVFVNIAFPKKHDSVVYIYGKKNINSNDWEIRRRLNYLGLKGEFDEERIESEIIKTLINRYFKKNSSEFNSEFWSD